MENEDLNEKLLKFAGFVKVYYRFPNPSGKYQWQKDGVAQGWLPNFIESLDACFKWLVPKYIAEASTLPMGLTSIMSIYAFLFAEWLKVMRHKVEPTLALCKVIEELIDNKAEHEV